MEKFVTEAPLSDSRLLAPDEPLPFAIEHLDGQSPFLISCDHASNRIPRALGDMGLNPADLRCHIAWDIGALAVSKRISKRLDATLVYQNYSRLVVDCNRAPHVPVAFPEISENTVIPANQNLSNTEKQLRVQAIHTPYHAKIEELIEQRNARQQPTIFIAMHSFTPVFKGYDRPWDMSVMYHRDPRLAKILLECIEATSPELLVGENEPYYVDDRTDYGIPVHGERRGIPHVLIELRQDLIEHESGQREWAELCCHWFQALLKRLPDDIYEPLRSTV